MESPCGKEQTMELGRKSIVHTVSIPNNSNPKKPYEVDIQANKNYGICDVSHCRNTILPIFQGRQINDGEVISEIEEILTVELNKEDKQ